jgi:hypothetical protein
MPYTFEITCSKCNFQQTDFIPFMPLEAYLLEDGSFVRVPNRVAWCGRCKQVVRAEEIPDIRKLETQKEIVKHRSRRFGWPPELFLNEAELLCCWRMTRVSSPKCLTCGSDELTIDCGQTDLVKSHPGCGGELHLREYGHVTLMESVWLRLLSPEGEDLGRTVENPSRFV